MWNTTNGYLRPKLEKFSKLFKLTQFSFKADFHVACTLFRFILYILFILLMLIKLVLYNGFSFYQSKNYLNVVVSHVCLKTHVLSDKVLLPVIPAIE